jgi:hypothetical protein
MTDLQSVIKRLLQNVILFACHASGIHLRGYQEQVAAAVVDSVLYKKGLTFVVIFPRQSGKNELQAQIETYLLVIFSLVDVEMVKVSPTWKPQSLNAMRRLERVLDRNMFTRATWAKRSGYIYEVGGARITFLSGAPTSNVVGATASLLLECDEAQDVSIAKWDKEINPMAASTNATTVFWGTAWTSQTLLAREKEAALKQEKKDGIRRVFQVDAAAVGEEVPEYKKFVRNEIAKLGRGHPFVKSQYFCETIDAESSMFPPERLEKMHGEHDLQLNPERGQLYAFLVDVAGEDEAAAGIEQDAEFTAGTEHDATALTIVLVDLESLRDEFKAAPTYRTVHRRMWTGNRHTDIYAELKKYADIWQPRRIVVDATGVGAGLASFLSKTFPSQVLPFIFTRKSKSDLGWNFLAIVETGRYKEHRPDHFIHGAKEKLQQEFWQQCSSTRIEITPGPERRLKWHVPDGARDPATGAQLHDDLVVSAAMCAILDDEEWGTAESFVIPMRDPLDDMSF